ncbi:MAG: GTP pyrophosphokinase [Acidimicrobiales bacterium]
MATTTSYHQVVGPSAASVEDAIVFATEAHRGRRYPSPEAEPYIFHSLRVMLGFTDPVDQMAAVLHDVVEDTDRDLHDLVEAGCPTEVVAAIDSLTHRPNEAYEDYIERVAANDIARRVKAVDLGENLANNLRSPTAAGNRARIARYEKALARLTQ